MQCSGKTNHKLYIISGSLGPRLSVVYCDKIVWLLYTMDELFIRGITKLSGYLYHSLHIHEWFTRDTALSVPLICMAAVVQMM